MWYVIRVRANAERTVAQALTGRCVKVFLPLHKQPSKQKNRDYFEAPLFPGYLFAQFTARELMAVVVCPGVICVLSRGNTPEPVDPSEMRVLLAIVGAHLPLSPLPALATGQKVRLTRGPLADLEAIVLKDDSRARVIVSISLLQRSIVAEVEREWLSDTDRITHVTNWFPAIA